MSAVIRHDGAMAQIKEVSGVTGTMPLLPHVNQRTTHPRSGLESFAPLTLAELDSEGLLARHDTKYVFHESVLTSMLEELWTIKRPKRKKNQQPTTQISAEDNQVL